MTHENEKDAAVAAVVRESTGSLAAKLSEAASLVRTANALDAEGLSDRAFRTLLEAEPLIHEAGSLLNAASIIRRHQRDDPMFS